MWSRVQIVALTALLAASYLPNRIEAEPVRQHRNPRFCSRMYAYSTARAAALSAPSNVLVRGNKIEKISTDRIADRQHR